MAVFVCLAPACFWSPAPPQPQHFVGNDLEGWEGATRHNFDARLSAADMRDTFLVPFEAAVAAGAQAFMCSYNRGGGRRRGGCEGLGHVNKLHAAGPGVGAGDMAPASRYLANLHPPAPPCLPVNGVPSCINKELLEGTLRGQLGFDGYVVTDCTGACWSRTGRVGRDGVQLPRHLRALGRAPAAGASKLWSPLPSPTPVPLRLPARPCSATALTRMVQPPPEGPGVEGGSGRRAQAAALKAGTDMACHAFERLEAKDVPRQALDTTVRRVLTARVRCAAGGWRGMGRPGLRAGLLLAPGRALAALRCSAWLVHCLPPALWLPLPQAGPLQPSRRAALGPPGPGGGAGPAPAPGHRARAGGQGRRAAEKRRRELWGVGACVCGWVGGGGGGGWGVGGGGGSKLLSQPACCACCQGDAALRSTGTPADMHRLPAPTCTPSSPPRSACCRSSPAPSRAWRCWAPLPTRRSTCWGEGGRAVGASRWRAGALQASAGRMQPCMELGSAARLPCSTHTPARTHSTRPASPISPRPPPQQVLRLHHRARHHAAGRRPGRLP